MSSVVTPLFIDAGEDLAPGKRELTKALNRDAILKAARAVFSEMGYEAASVRDIIRRTGLASGTFYNYYRSKEEVAKALIADVAQRLSPILRAQREQAHDFESYLNGAIRAYFQFIVDEEQRNWSPGRPRAERRPYIKVQTPEQGAVFEEIQSSINLVIEHGLGPRVDTRFLTAAVIGVAQNIGEAMLARDPIDIEAAARFAVELILHGLAALPRLPA
ncbi:MAG: TetR/AcrR family transcriptional regulator [Aliidongia sp.]